MGADGTWDIKMDTPMGSQEAQLELTTDAPAGDGPLVEIRAKTVSGDIRITRASAPVNDNGSSHPVQEVHS